MYDFGSTDWEKLTRKLKDEMLAEIQEGAVERKVDIEFMHKALSKINHEAGRRSNGAGLVERPMQA